MVALPDRSVVKDVQLASDNDVRVYVLEDIGDTFIIYGLVLVPFIVTGVVPSVYVKVHGAVPVRATLKLVLDPLQIVVVPVITEVGRGLTVIIL
jgi:hypothetical protein